MPNSNVGRSTGHPPTAETHRNEASTPPQRPFRALSGPPLDRRRTMGQSAPTWQLGAPLRSDLSCSVKASSPL
eukprot:11138569-Alexandrium_andersonii.AAC.1